MPIPTLHHTLYKRAMSLIPKSNSADIRVALERLLPMEPRMGPDDKLLYLCSCKDPKVMLAPQPFVPCRIEPSKYFKLKISNPSRAELKEAVLLGDEIWAEDDEVAITKNKENIGYDQKLADYKAVFELAEELNKKWVEERMWER